MARPPDDCIPPSSTMYWVNRKPKVRVCEATDGQLARWKDNLINRAEHDSHRPGGTRDMRDYLPPIYYTVLDEIKRRAA